MGLYENSHKLIWGYVNLSKLEDSLIYTNDEVLLAQLKDLNLALTSKVYHFNEEMDDLFVDYASYELDVMKKIQTDTTFVSKPKEPKTCQYCELANICPRGESNV